MSNISDRVKFHIPSVGKEEEDAVLEVLKSGWLTTGKKVKEFEENFATFVGAKHAIAVSSATAGLFLSLKALGVNYLSYVLTTPYTFISTAEVIEWCGTTPTFIDVEEDTYNIDSSKIITNWPFKVVIPVHIAGVKCDMEKIYKRFPESAIVEDCAHYFPSKFDGRSKTAVYSFYATKSITTGEGGMIVTNDDTLAEQIRVLLNHGIKQSTFDRYTSAKNKWYYEVHELGYKFNMMDLSAALGVVQLKKANILNDARTLVAKKYLEELKKLDFIVTPVDRPDNTWHLFMIRVKPENLTIDRDQFIEELTKENIGVSVHYIPVHMMPYYKKKGKQHFPVAEKLFKTTMSLPIFPDMTNEEIEKVINAIKSIGERNHK